MASISAISIMVQPGANVKSALEELGKALQKAAIHQANAYAMLPKLSWGRLGFRTISEPVCPRCGSFKGCSWLDSLERLWDNTTRPCIICDGGKKALRFCHACEAERQSLLEHGEYGKAFYWELENWE